MSTHERGNTDVEQFFYKDMHDTQMVLLHLKFSYLSSSSSLSNDLKLLLLLISFKDESKEFHVDGKSIKGRRDTKARFALGTKKSVSFLRTYL